MVIHCVVLENVCAKYLFIDFKEKINIIKTLIFFVLFDELNVNERSI